MSSWDDPLMTVPSSVLEWDERAQDPLADIRYLIERFKNEPLTIKERKPDAFLPAWAFDYVSGHPRHEGCGGEWVPLGLHFWCSECRKALTREMTEGA